MNDIGIKKRLVPMKKAAKNIMPAIGPLRENDLEKASKNDGHTLIPVTNPSKTGQSANLFHRGALQPESHFFVLNTEIRRNIEKSR